MEDFVIDHIEDALDIQGKLESYLSNLVPESRIVLYHKGYKFE